MKTNSTAHSCPNMDDILDNLNEDELKEPNDWQNSVKEAPTLEEFTGSSLDEIKAKIES